MEILDSSSSGKIQKKEFVKALAEVVEHKNVNLDVHALADEVFDRNTSLSRQDIR